MRMGSRTFRWLALFLIVDAGVYLATAREFTGGALIAATAGAFGYLAFVVGGVVRHATRELNAEPSGDVGAVELDHVGSTIWPAGFALSAIMLAFGAVVIRWLLVPGGVLFVASALGWAADVRHQHEAHHPAPDGSVSHAPETPAP